MPVHVFILLTLLMVPVYRQSNVKTVIFMSARCKVLPLRYMKDSLKKSSEFK